MALTLDQLADAAMDLPANSRAELAERLVESLDAADNIEVQRIWAAEAHRRGMHCSQKPGCWKHRIG